MKQLMRLGSLVLVLVACGKSGKTEPSLSAGFYLAEGDLSNLWLGL